MSDSKRVSGPQFRADRPQEQEAVRTTIVGGRPPGSGQRLGAIPRGVEVLVKKASVDVSFRQVLLAERAEAAERIGLTLDPAEAMMLAAVPAEQLEVIIAQTTVPQEHRRAFLGTAATAMLAAVGVTSLGCDDHPAPAGSAPDYPPSDANGRPTRNPMGESGGAAPDEPPDRPRDAVPPTPQDGSGDEPLAAPVEPPAPGPHELRPTRGIRPDLPEPPPKT